MTPGGLAPHLRLHSVKQGYESVCPVRGVVRVTSGADSSASISLSARGGFAPWAASPGLSPHARVGRNGLYFPLIEMNCSHELQSPRDTTLTSVLAGGGGSPFLPRATLLPQQGVEGTFCHGHLLLWSPLRWLPCSLVTPGGAQESTMNQESRMQSEVVRPCELLGPSDCKRCCEISRFLNWIQIIT